MELTSGEDVCFLEIINSPIKTKVSVDAMLSLNKYKLNYQYSEAFSQHWFTGLALTPYFNGNHDASSK